jgi:hypothetical protein
MLPSAGEFFKSYGLTPEKAGAGQARRHRDAPGADQPRRRDRLGGGRRQAERDPAAGHLRHRGAHGGDVASSRGTKQHEDPDQERPGDRPGQRATSAPTSPSPGPHRRHRRGPPTSTPTASSTPAACIVAPGLVDLAARLREPGHEHEGMLESELAAAAAGGVTSLVCPPDTDPVLDEPGLVEMLKFRARKLHQLPRVPAGRADARPARRGADRDGRADRGRLRRLRQADVPRADTQVLLRALQYAATFGYTVWLRPQDPGWARAWPPAARWPRAWACPACRWRPRRSRCTPSSSWCAPPARGCTCAGCPAPPAWRCCAGQGRGPAGDLPTSASTRCT